MLTKLSTGFLFLFIIVVFSCNNDSNSNLELNASSPCDDILAIDDQNPINAVKAIDICQEINAAFIRADGTSASHSNQIGILNLFGSISPNKGERMLMLSTGAARSLNQPNACGSNSCQGNGQGNAPNGFPQDVFGCPPSSDIFDDIGLEITLTVPENANGFTFDFIFFTFDYPEFLCFPFNDQFIVTLDTNPPGSINGNIVFDANDTPICVNSSFINLGLNNLMDLTGFNEWGDAATTGWVRTSAPVSSGEEITLRFIIYDTGDANSDSSIIIDNFKWVKEIPTVSSTPI